MLAMGDCAINISYEDKVDKEGNVDIFLRLFGDLGLDEAVLIENTSNMTGNKPNAIKDSPDMNGDIPNTSGNMPNTTETNNVPNNNNHTQGRNRTPDAD